MSEVIVPNKYRLTSKTDLNGMITYVNHEFIEISGFSEMELLGQSHNIIRHPDMPKAVFSDLWLTLEAGEPWVQILKNQCKNGDFYWVMAHVSPIFESGHCIGYMSVRSAASPEQIQQAQQQYKKLEANQVILKSGDFLSPWQSKIDFIYQFIDRIPFSLLFSGLMLGLLVVNYFLFNTTEITEWSPQLLFIAVAGAMGFYLDNKLKKAENIALQLRNHQLSSEITHARSGSLKKLRNTLVEMQIQVGSDIDELNKQHHRDVILQKGWDLSSSNLMLTDVNFNIVYINQSLIKFFNQRLSIIQDELPHFQIDRLIGQNIDQFHTAPHSIRFFLRNLTESHQIVMQMGSLNITVKIHPIFDSENKRISTLVEWVDSTDEHQLAMQLNNLNRSIDEGSFNERLDSQNVPLGAQALAESINQTMDLIQQQQKQLISQSRHAVMGEMIAMISHQWKQPLNVLSMDNSMIKRFIKRDENMDDHQKEVITKALVRSQTMIIELNDTITDFTDFFRPIQSKENFTLAEALESSLSLIKPVLDATHIQLTVNVEPVIIYGVRRELQQVLTNIIKNAIDQLSSHPVENPEIHIATESQKNCTKLTITDNGGGIKASIIDSLFDAYASTKSLNGTGLGLYMCKLIITEHFNGLIEAKNVANGAQFMIHIPKSPFTD